jgi:hypothetical protein
MKAGIVSNSKSSNNNKRSNGNTIYVMGVAPGVTSIVTILGVPYLSMYGNSPYRRNYFEQFETEGSPTEQALEICDASREFFPLAMVVESTNRPDILHVADRIAFCHETHYVTNTFFWQTLAQSLKSFPDEDMDSTRHAMTFLKRAKEITDLRDAAWGPAQARIRPAKKGSVRARRRLYSTYERANGRHAV